MYKVTAFVNGKQIGETMAFHSARAAWHWVEFTERVIPGARCTVTKQR